MICKKSAASVAVNRQSSIANRKSQNGIALVITLILLAVALVMALAFWAVSRRESASVASAADTATARNAADSGRANAEAQVMANIFSTVATTDPAVYNFGLLVSTNYTLNPLANLANVPVSPRAPVLISQAEPSGRFYLDLNRNGRFDSNGMVAQVDSTGATNGIVSFQVGDPEWIGVLEHPDQPYGPNNLFISRFAFIAVPAGNDEDLNAIYNQTETATVNPAPNTYVIDGFFRNEGIGSWELNLASFLTDLDTNIWDPPSDFYNYREPNFQNQGRGFEDALSLLSYRYNFNYNSLPVGFPALYNNSIDGYTVGQLMTNTFLPSVLTPVNLSWAGSDNTNHYFTPSDLFDPTKTSIQFTNDLISAGISNATYDSDTFYRLLSQIGTDTAPESGKMNLNYDNLDASGNVIPGAETNFISWQTEPNGPLKFFTNAADRILRTYTANWFAASSNNFYATFGVTNSFGVANIPVYVNGQFVYSPAVQRVLQLAANIYDSTVNNSSSGSPDYPDVFRPLFSLSGTNIFISGYTNLSSASGPNTVSGPADLQLSQPFDAATISTVGVTSLPSNDNIYGVPWIIGAKKGFPNFNEFAAENSLSVTRRLQFTRLDNATSTTASTITSTNQMYMMALNSSLGIELWNSYASSYPGTITIGFNESGSLSITNDDQGPRLLYSKTFLTNGLFSITPWPGAGTQPWYAGNPNPLSFEVFNFTGASLTNSVYRSAYAGGATLGNPPISPPGFIPTNYFPITSPSSISLFESNSPNGFHLPQFGVLLTNRLQVFMLDFTNNIYHVIDYAHFAGPDANFNMNTILADADSANNNVGVWNTNYPTTGSTAASPTYGILNQIQISKNGSPAQEDGLWQADPEAVNLGGTKAQQQQSFQAFFLPGNRSGNVVNRLLSVTAPYAPTRYIVQYVTWQANDPLVHYLASDIDSPSPNNTTTPRQGLNESSVSASTFAPLTGLNLGSLNDRYMPWGGNPKFATSDLNPYNTSLKDPNVFSSDNWDFPSYKLPTTGWIGRVHRGTPWQTVYLKSLGIDDNTWAQWMGDTQITFNQFFDAANSEPVQDRLLFDLFTTAPNDNATRGQLSVNQSGLAAWSALLGGVVALNNPSAGTVTNVTIQPAGVYNPTNNLPPLVQIWQDINIQRAFHQNVDGLRGAFEHVGDILGAAHLTDQSPFFNIIPQSVDPVTGQIVSPPIYPSDEVMEWLPQQVMSLLRVGTPRYVIYSYGQALKPAPSPNGVFTANGLLITNYQVVAEAADRVVVRFDSTVTNINGTLTVTNNRAVIESYNIMPPD